MANHFRHLVAILVVFTVLPFSVAQLPSTGADSCNGVFLLYTYSGGKKLLPNLTSDPTQQPYRFESVLTVLNNGLVELKSWRVFAGFKHGEYLVSASNAVLADGTSMPVNVSNGTVLSGYPMTDLMTAVGTARDLTQIQVQVRLVGMQFGVAPPDFPLPSNISLANDGWVCPSTAAQGNVAEVCCKRDPNAKSNITVDEGFLPRQNGDLTIMYDVIQTYESSYMAQVTLSNHNPLGRLDNWKLSWKWTRGEFIKAMRGAYPSVVDSSRCIFGPQGTYYRSLDFSTVLNCDRTPTIIELPPTMYNDTTLGLIPYCCRNDTILPREMDPSKSISTFRIEVYKMPPNLNRSLLIPPVNWNINGTLNPDYQCGQPVRVSPSQFPDQSGLPLNSTAIASWQVVCNITCKSIT